MFFISVCYACSLLVWDCSCVCVVFVCGSIQECMYVYVDMCVLCLCMLMSVFIDMHVYFMSVYFNDSLCVVSVCGSVHESLCSNSVC